jgi:hypothetical protein
MKGVNVYLGVYAKCLFEKDLDMGGSLLPLRRKLIGDQLYMVSTNTKDGTNQTIDFDSEIRLDFSVMVDALLKFNSLYKEQLYNLSQYGKVEVHFGILNTDE